MKLWLDICCCELTLKLYCIVFNAQLIICQRLESSTAKTVGKKIM